MDSMQDTIVQYQHSILPLRERIRRLSLKLSGKAPLSEGESLKSLENRRYLLYCEIAQMEYSIAAMRQYLSLISR